MGDLRVGHRDAETVYEITLNGQPPASLTVRYPSITFYSTPAATILSRQVVDSAEVVDFMDRLRSIGVTPVEVHASPCGHPLSTHRTPKSSQLGDYYEFRIEGRLGDSILHYLQWTARLEGQRTVMRVHATDLQAILEDLAANGMRIEHFIRRQAS
jgi:hypothetical protein